VTEKRNAVPSPACTGLGSELAIDRAVLARRSVDGKPALAGTPGKAARMPLTPQDGTGDN